MRTRDLLGRVKFVHRSAYMAGIGSHALTNGVVLVYKAGEAGIGIHPVGLKEDLLAESGSFAQLLQVELSHVSLAPVVLHIAGDDDHLAPAIGNAIGLACGHLEDQ